VLPTSGSVVLSVPTTVPDGWFSATLEFDSKMPVGASFTISGNTLKTAASFDYEAKKSYSVRIRSTDQGGLCVERMKTIDVADLNELAAAALGIGAGEGDSPIFAANKPVSVATGMSPRKLGQSPVPFSRAHLLAAVMYEMGDVLGHEDIADDLMSAMLPLGSGRTPMGA
jgi:hypothetical protein